MTKKEYFKLKAKLEREQEKAAYKERVAKRAPRMARRLKKQRARARAKAKKRNKNKPEEPKKLTHAIARDCANARGVSIRFMAKWLRGSKNREQLINESLTAVCPDIINVSPDTSEFDKHWALTNTIKSIKASYKSVQEVEEVCNIAAMIDIGARDIFTNEAVDSFIYNIKKVIENKPWPVKDKEALIKKYNNIFNHE